MFVNGPAPSGVMVPSLTASGYRVSWKWRRAWLLPPEPSKYLRPHSTFPSVRFIQIFSWRSHTSHRQPLQCRETKVLMEECCISWTKMGGKISTSFLFENVHTSRSCLLVYSMQNKIAQVSSVAYHFSTVSHVTSIAVENTILRYTPPNRIQQALLEMSSHDMKIFPFCSNIRYSWRDAMSHLGGILTPLSSCFRSAACFDSILTSPSHCCTCKAWDTESAATMPAMDWDTYSGRQSNIKTLYLKTDSELKITQYCQEQL